MRAALVLPLVALAFAGCTTLDLDPLGMACEDERVQQAGWCGSGPPGGGAADGGATPGPSLQRRADGVTWTLRGGGEDARHAFAWDSPGRARLTWSAGGSGAMQVMVQTPGAVAYDSDHGQAGDSVVLIGRPGSWAVTVALNRFGGEAVVDLQSA